MFPQEHEVREALESLVGLQVQPCNHDTLKFSHASGFEFELGPASPADSWATGQGAPNTRYLPLHLGSTAEVCFLKFTDKKMEQFKHHDLQG